METPRPSESNAAQELAADRVAGLEGESHLIVSLGGPLYAIPILGIEQILPMRPVAPLPRSSAVVRGVLFLRGHPVSVIDLAMLLGLPDIRARRIVVLVIESERYGLIVEEVLKVAPPGSLRDLSAPPATLEVHPAVRAVARLRDEIVSLLDPERLVPAAAPRPAA
jgi:purine-binding chemotaxis protein CheW